MHLGRCCHCTPPVPYPGAITRYMLPSAIADTESLQTAADWSTGNFRSHWAARFTVPNAIEFIGTECALYYYVLNVDAGTGENKVVSQPIRWSVCEPTTSGGDFEVLTSVGQVLPGITGAYQATGRRRNELQAFGLGTWLPVSGDSHADDSDPFQATLRQTVNALDFHVGYLHGELITTVFPPAIRKPQKSYVFGRYAQWRVNGTAVGPVHDLLAYAIASIPNATTGYDGLAEWNQLFPSGSPLWTLYGSLLENWNLQFESGDTIELDIWYEIAAQQTTAGARKLTVSLFRYATNDDQQVIQQGNPTPSAGFSLRGPTGLAVPSALTLSGINMSPGFDPALHTYTFDASNGQFSFGKAEADGAIRFSVTSKSLEWSIERNAGGSCGGTSLWEWQEVEGVQQWVMIEDNCTGGGVAVAPPIPDFSIEIGAQETTACDCSTAGSGDTWQFTLNLVYEDEIAYLRLFGAKITPPTATVLLYYRPESSADYVDTVNDRWEGTLRTGPTGVFNHLGATTFVIYRGISNAATYPTSLPTQYAAFAGVLPTQFVVTKVAQ